MSNHTFVPLADETLDGLCYIAFTSRPVTWPSG